MLQVCEVTCLCMRQAQVLFAMKSVWNFYDLEFKNYYYFSNLRSTR